jgi:ribosomal protein S12 methylthiotransferase accessory factor
MYAHVFCTADSNGVAAGSSLEEAVVQGFYELIERDSVAVWWYNMLRLAALDLDSVPDPYVSRIREYHASLGREMWALDLTTDSGVPAYAVLSRRTAYHPQEILLGFGAHLDPRAAFDAALDEMNQFLPAIVQSSDDSSQRYAMVDGPVARWLEEATIENQPYLVPDRGKVKTRLSSVPDRSNSDLREDVLTCSRVARALRSNLYVVDATRCDSDLSVARVIAPGLRHFWRRLGPGRLYDVPVSSGVLPHPRAEAELNPETIFF